MGLKVPLQISIAFVTGFLKSKSAVLIHRKILKTKRVGGLLSVSKPVFTMQD